MGKDKIEFEQIIERGCGIDVHKKVIVATIGGKGIKEETRTYDSYTSSLRELQEWLKAHGVTHIAMESTGVYWKPLYNIFEDGFEIVLVNARHIKNVPGRKTDKKDSKWILKLLLSGLLSGSFIPPRHIRELRDLTRYRRKVVGQISSEKNRLQKILEDANIKLSSVLSDMSGSTATKIINKMLSGVEDVKALSKLRHGRMKSSKAELEKSLEGHITEHHKFMLRMIKESIEEKEGIVKKIETRIEKHLKENELEMDVKLLESIPGVGREGAVGILAEIGDDMSRFPSEKHLSSWAGMSPGNNESAGKKKSSRITHGNKYLKIQLTQSGWAATRTKKTYLRSKYESIVIRRGKKRALIAIGHKILIAAYYMLRDKKQYRELGYDYLLKRNTKKKIKRHLKQLKQLGVEVEIKQVA